MHLQYFNVIRFQIRNYDDFTHYRSEAYDFIYDFYSVPYEFLCRDKWADIHKQGEAARSDGVNIHEYEKENAEGRVHLLTTLHNLRTNREDDEDGDDGDLQSSNSDSESIDESDSDSESESDSDSGSDSTSDSGSGKKTANKILNYYNNMPSPY